MRCCWVGMHLGEAIDLKPDQLCELYYTLLLKDAGCSSNAARVCELYVGDDLKLKHEFKLLDGSMGPALRFVLTHTGLQADLATRFRAIVNILGNADGLIQELIEARCQRGADIARKLRFSEGVAQGIQNLDERWDGGGKPLGLAGSAIPIYSQIALLAQVVDVFHTAAGRQAAEDEVARREAWWFDPRLVRAFRRLARDDAFWAMLASDRLAERVFQLEPGQHRVLADEDYLDDIAAAFGQVVDAKSPFTAGHSMRVAIYTDLICRQLGLSPDHRRWIKRGAMLHDIGKLAISNSLLDKPGRLEGEEWRTMMDHPRHTGEILSRIAAFKELAPIAAAHHERLDGTGYPLGLRGDEITIETRIMSVADFFDALTADRPYRKALRVEKALQIMEENAGPGLDPMVFETFKSALAGAGQGVFPMLAQDGNALPERLAG
ncbi:MAG: HD domain-containing phosphohydrolase [Hyphomicrobiales bacterium]